MFSKALVIGDTGMAGKAFVSTLERRGLDVIGMSRRDSDLVCDIATNSNQMISQIIKHRPEIVVNCAACVSLEECEKNQRYANSINAEAVKAMVYGCTKINARFVQVSTDHYYEGDEKYLHHEADPTVIKNIYAQTKLAAEKYTISYPKAIILRTNITGFRRDAGRPTFIEWLLDAIRTKTSISLFTDFFTSTIDAVTFAEISLMVAESNFSGILNIASSECLSKKEFALAVADAIGVHMESIHESTVHRLKPPRANSLGLDCSRAEALLGINMPNTSQIIRNLLIQERYS